jgi:fructuronate reductase
LGRFANPTLGHRLEQIAMDGSQKIPQRWLPTLRYHQRQGRQCPAILDALAAWMLHVRQGDDVVADPMAETLAQVWHHAGRQGVAGALFGPSGLFAEHWVATPADLELLGRRLNGMV